MGQVDGHDPNQVWVKAEVYQALSRAFGMCVDALDVVAMDGPGEVTVNQLGAMAKIVAKSARAIAKDGYDPDDHGRTFYDDEETR
ncbi:MAG: hypothetical protein SHS37scaffold145_50 [Phage 71_18]|nr:MAG: hypothetical protein SHS37scaffold145_50 [Phage 71_18]